MDAGRSMEGARNGKGVSLASSIARRVERIFARLGDYPYFTPHDLEEFVYYHRHFRDCLAAIDERIRSGDLRPMDLRNFPRETRLPDYHLRAALFMGSFDPFQMTHLATALRFLASPEARADVVFVIPEGGASALKPNRSEYQYRLDILNRQIKGIFEPLVAPLDLGEGTDTLGIVNRFMGLFPGSSLEITHLLGSDVLPIAAGFMEADLREWRAEARRLDVRMEYRMHVVRRLRTEGAVKALRSLRAKGIQVTFDRRLIDYPSSTDFREAGAFTIVFPTDDMLSHLEVLFRYNLNRPWMRPGGAASGTAPDSGAPDSGAPDSRAPDSGALESRAPFSEEASGAGEGH